MPQTVDRALLVLSMVANRPCTLADLAAGLRVSKSTALRLAQSLERAGYVRKNPDGAYVLGSTILALASRALDSHDVRAAARPFLTRLNDSTGHAVHLASLIDREAVYIDKLEGRTPLRMYSSIGKSVSLYTSAVGKVLLAYQPEPTVSLLISRIDFRSHTPATITNEYTLRRELATVREQGFARDRGEFEPMIRCIAAPIRNADGSVTSAVSISAPAVLTTIEELERLLPNLTAATDSVSHANGWMELVDSQGSDRAMADPVLAVP